MQPTIPQPLTSLTRETQERNTESVSPADFRAGVISVDPERQSGSPCFAGTRVPIRDLFDFVEGGESLETFLLSFPTVRREQVLRVLQLAEERLLEGLAAK